MALFIYKKLSLLIINNLAKLFNTKLFYLILKLNYSFYSTYNIMIDLSKGEIMKKRIVGVLCLLLITFTGMSAEVQNFGSILFSNGPIVTSSGTGVGGADESVLQNNSLSMQSFGTGHHASANLRVADDFTVPNSGWQIDSIDFYAYQTNETASTITTINLRIWDGVPSAPGSNVIFGDTSTNVLTSTNNSGILRVDESTQGTDSARQIAISNVALDLALPAGTYWLEWQSTGTGPSGPFVPHITIPGQTTTGNALLSTDGGASYANIQDSGTFTDQGLPFIINGSGQQAVAVPSLNFLGLMLLVGLLLTSVLKSKQQLSFRK